MEFKFKKDTPDMLKKLEKIKSDLRKEIKLDNPIINFNDSVFKNFYSKGHLLVHVGIAVTERIGIGFLYLVLLFLDGNCNWNSCSYWCLKLFNKF